MLRWLHSSFPPLRFVLQEEVEWTRREEEGCSWNRIMRPWMSTWLGFQCSWNNREHEAVRCGGGSFFQRSSSFPLRRHFIFNSEEIMLWIRRWSNRRDTVLPFSELPFASSRELFLSRHIHHIRVHSTSPWIFSLCWRREMTNQLLRNLTNNFWYHFTLIDALPCHRRTQSSFISPLWSSSIS